MELVSVIIATHNRAQLISETLQSVINQTYSDLEVIVVSDGPSDDSRKAVEVFADSRIKYYEITHSGRPAVPRNFGISKAQGQYLAFCDDDDLWMPEKLILQMAEMKKNKDLGLIYTQCILNEAEQERIVPRYGKQGFIFRELFLSPCFIGSITVLMKREIIETVGLFDEDMRWKAVEDYDFWLRIARVYKIGFIGQPLAVHRESKDSISKGSFIKLKRECLIAYRFYHEKYIGLGLFIEKMALLCCRVVLNVMRKFLIKKRKNGLISS